MYPLVFLRPEGNKWTLGAAFFGFCALTILFMDQVKSSHELEDIVKSMLPEEQGWGVPAEAPTT